MVNKCNLQNFLRDNIKPRNYKYFDNIKIKHFYMAEKIKRHIPLEKNNCKYTTNKTIFLNIQIALLDY